MTTGVCRPDRVTIDRWLLHSASVVVVVVVGGGGGGGGGEGGDDGMEGF